MNLFRILQAFGALVAIAVFGFFLVGLADGTVSSFNIGLWLVLLGVAGGVMWGSHWLHTHEKPGLAKALLLVLAVPGVLFLLFLLVILVSEPRWN